MALHKIFKDALLIQSKACPAAGATAQSGTIDLGANRKPIGMELEVSIPAMAANTDPTKSLTVKIQESDDDSTYTDAAMPAVVTAGVATRGSAAKVVYLPLPVDLKRYIQANLAVSASGPNLTANSVTVSVVF
jgi:hypothetical protein